MFVFVFIYSNAEINRLQILYFCNVFKSWFLPSVFSASFIAHFFHFVRSFNLKISVAEKEEKCFSFSTHCSLILWASFSLFKTHAAPDRIKAQLWRLLLCSLTNFDSNRCRVKQICLPFYIVGDPVMLDYVMFFRSSFWNKWLGRLSPATSVYMPQRQTRALLSGEKLSSLVLIWLIVYGFCRVLENCSPRLVGV